MGKIPKLILIIMLIVVAVNVDENIIFPAILQNIHHPFDWVLDTLISGSELVGFVKLLS
jgi:hypothetical protein